jgi:hypothetical protein
LESRDLGRNQDADGRARYWDLLSKKMILREHNETKVYLKVCKRLHKKCKRKKGNPSERKPIVPLIPLCQDYLGTAATYVAPPLQIWSYKIRKPIINPYYLYRLPKHSPVYTALSHDSLSDPDL